MASIRALFPAWMLLQCAQAASHVGTCSPATLDFIILEGEQQLIDMEDDIRADLEKVGITVNLRALPKDDFNTAMTTGDFHLAFSEPWGPPYDPQTYAASWKSPDEAYYAALKGLPAPNTYEKTMEKISAALQTTTEKSRQDAWTEIFTILHDAATELSISGKRIPSVINKRLSGYRDGLQQYDYPLHTLRVESGAKTVTIAPGSSGGLFATIGRLDAHSYRPNEFWANNLVYEGLVEYGPGGNIIPSLASSWTVADDGDGQKYTFTLRPGVTFHDGEAWDCSVAKLNFDHAFHATLRASGDCGHGWYELPKHFDTVSCLDDMTLVIRSKVKYYPFLQELAFIRPTRMMSPAKFADGATTDPTTRNSCPVGNDCDDVVCAGITGIAGTGPWKFTSKVDTVPEELIRGSPANDEVTFTRNTEHWDYTAAAWNVETLKIKRYADGAAVKAALLDGSLDAVIGAGVLSAADIVDFRDNRADAFATSFTEALQNRIVIINTQKAPTDDIQLRKVIIHGVDKAALVEKELKGIDQPVNQLFPTSNPYCNVRMTPVWDYDFEKAQLLNCPEPFITPDALDTRSKAISTGAALAIIMAAFLQ